MNDEKTKGKKSTTKRKISTGGAAVGYNETFFNWNKDKKGPRVPPPPKLKRMSSEGEGESN
jgi:hypothetical protein